MDTITRTEQEFENIFLLQLLAKIIDYIKILLYILSGFYFPTPTSLLEEWVPSKKMKTSVENKRFSPPLRKHSSSPYIYDEWEKKEKNWVCCGVHSHEEFLTKLHKQGCHFSQSHLYALWNLAPRIVWCTVSVLRTVTLCTRHPITHKTGKYS